MQQNNKERYGVSAIIYYPGAKPTRDPVALHEIEPSAALLHSVVAVSHAEGADALLLKNVAGFLYMYVLWFTLGIFG